MPRRKLTCGNDPVHLGGRSMDILIELARSKGSLVPKDVLVAKVWPNLTVHDGNLKVTVAALRRALREHAPSVDYIGNVVGRGYWLRDDDEAGRATAQIASSGASLPDLAMLIGREDEIAAIRASLAANRLTTIAGPGGIGKTTVAVAAAQLFEDDGRGAVTFVDLARVASDEFVTASLAVALGIRADGSDSLQSLVSILAGQKILLVLDTCEHVLGAVAHISNVILAGAPEVRILATSRQVLRARGEKVIWLEPLPVPPDEPGLGIAEVLRYAAPRLLAARARDKAELLLNDHHAGVLGEICRRLDGSPLAIELVAPRLAGRSPEEVLAELDDRFKTLRRSAGGGPLRHQTMLMTLEWSYALLTEDEAAMLRAASVFAGTFGADEVRIVSGGALGPAAAADAVSGLRLKSVFSVDEASGELRYRLLDSTRAFAANLLESHGELAEVSARYANLLLDVLRRAETDLLALNNRRWRAVYGARSDDLRRAIEWTLNRGNDPLLGVQLVAAGLPLWQELSQAEESRRNCERALVEFDRQGGTDRRLQLAIMVALASANTYLSADPDKAAHLFDDALRLARDLGDVKSECRILGALALYQLLPGYDSDAPDTLEAMRQAAIRANDRAAQWEVEKHLSEWETLQCDFPSACSRLERLLEVMPGFENPEIPQGLIHQRIKAQVHLGAMHWLMGRPGQALALTRDVVSVASGAHHDLTLIHCLAHGAIFTYMRCGAYEEAAACCGMLTRAVYRSGAAGWLPLARLYTASVAAAAGPSPPVAELQSCFDELRTGMNQIGNHSYYATLTEAMLAACEYGKAREVIDFVLDMGAQKWIRPEFLRMKAAVLRSDGLDDEALTLLREALLNTVEIGCRSWGIRIVVDIGRLLRDNGAIDEARDLVEPVLAEYDDGSDTEDLARARALLAEL
ncbi:winged helix-turn-helix domain-containing protein [Microvirga sesbaniae]|uniref:winged helix-turn-helix domain-containing protein n=1 Tax=Microvirga sesbaniae TaxID=681392 RepID=UPI0021CA5F93|nr:winged helix-turn-helix domain-containing protein [Microvirga sp. HBU67692]